MGVIRGLIDEKNKNQRKRSREDLRAYWRDYNRKKRQREKELSSRFDNERNPNETFTEFRIRMKMVNTL